MVLLYMILWEENCLSIYFVDFFVRILVSFMNRSSDMVLLMEVS